MKFYPGYLGLILVLTFFSVARSNSQPAPARYKLKAVYKLEYQKDSTNPKSVREEYLQLYYGDSGSLFESFNYSMIDSAISSENKKGNRTGPSFGFLMGMRTEFMYLIQKQKDAIITYDYIGAYNLYSYKEERNLFNWQITQDTASIGGIPCQKAETIFGGRKWNAWFAQEIPISDGPYKFCGLPGLILKITDSRNFWNFSIASISNIDTTIAPTLQNEKPEMIKSKNAYLKELKYYKDNLIDIEFARGGLKFSSSEEKDRNERIHREQRKLDNNWIELYDGIKE